MKIAPVARATQRKPGISTVAAYPSFVARSRQRVTDRTPIESSVASATPGRDGGALATPAVLLTREGSKNGKMKKELQARGFWTVELPLIEHTSGPDLPRLREILRGFSASESKSNDASYAWILLTSPEAASVFLAAWKEAGKPKLPPVAVVGGGTGDALKAAGVNTSFVASKALGENLGRELPRAASSSTSTLPASFAASTSSSALLAASPPTPNLVLYPTSRRAKGTVETGLRASGFDVVRLDTYDTVPVDYRKDATTSRVPLHHTSTTSSSLEHDSAAARSPGPADLGFEFMTSLERARSSRVRVVTLASPSTAKAWVDLVGLEEARRKLTVCIGVTTAKACYNLGLDSGSVFYPESPGVAAWADCVEEAVKGALKCSF